MPEQCEPIIEAKDLTFWYPAPDDTGGGADAAPPRRGKTVFENIGFSVPQGQLVAVLGRNGSGKSTLAKHFNAILLPCGGSVTVAGIDTCDEERIYDIRQTVGMVFQNPDNQLVATVVEEDVAFALENLGVEPAEIRRRVDEALKVVGMYEYRTHAPHQLSGGQKQRVAIAGILAMHPRCLVLDEPTAMLDPRGRREVMETVLRLNREEGVTVVLITHFMDEAVRADRVVVIDEGKLLLDGAPRAVFARAGILRSAGLDVPQATELVQELNASGRLPEALPGDVLTADECVACLETLLADTQKAR